jgi:DNA-binding CsgD family transcriptional regulator
MPAATIAQIQAVQPEFALSDLDSAQRVGVAEVTGEQVRFTHPLLASTVYAQADGARRREVHRLLAEIVADTQTRAHHLALGAEAPDRRIALTLEHAATNAGRRGAPEVAAQLLEQASRLTPADALEARRSRTLAAAEQHYASGDLDRARALLEELLPMTPGGPFRARVLLVLARIRTDDFDAAAELAEQARQEPEAQPRTVARAHDLLAELCANRGDPGVGLVHATEGVRAAELSGDPALVSRLLASEALMRFFNGGGVQEQLLARAVALEGEDGSVSTYFRASTGLGTQRFWSDELDSARPLLERAVRAARERGEELDLVGLLFHLAHLEYEAGDEPAARRDTAEAIALARHLVDDQATSYVLWLRAFAAARHGALVEARAAAGEAIEVARRIGDHFIVSFATAIEAAIDLWTGHPESAHETVAGVRAGLVGNGRGFVGSLTLNLWTTDIEALLALDRTDDAEAVLSSLVARPDAAANPNALAVARRCAGLIAAARGDLGGAITELEAALVEHARRPLPLELGRTLLELGTIQRRAKRKSAAKASLEHAVAVLTPLSAELWIARARDELARVGIRRAARQDGLTPAQQRVATLAAQGMTNREIAATLFMSQRTVETHLTKIYSELGIKTRTQLAATLAAQTPAAGATDV